MGVPKIRPKVGRRHQEGAARALQLLLEESVALQRAFAHAAKPGVGARSQTAPHRVLQRLRSGPQSVPQLSRQMGVTRQHVQTVVNRLLRAGWLAPRTNPAHRRSRLLSLTPLGKQVLTELDEDRDRRLHAAGIELDAGELYAAVECLRRVRRVLRNPPLRS